MRVHSGEGGGAPFKNEKHVLDCFILFNFFYRVVVLYRTGSSTVQVVVREQRLKRTRRKVEKRVRVHSGEGGGAPFKNEKHVLVCFISCLHFSTG